MGFKDIACATKPHKQRFYIKVYSDSSKRLPEMKRESKYSRPAQTLHRRCPCCKNASLILGFCLKQNLHPTSPILDGQRFV